MRKLEVDIFKNFIIQLKVFKVFSVELVEVTTTDYCVKIHFTSMHVLQWPILWTY